MSKNSKLTKVLEYLIKNDEEKAKELLHQVFIEKARAIHEDMMSHDDEMEEDIGGSGDEGKDFRNAVNARGQDAHSEAVDAQIRAMENEIDFEETMNEDNLDEFKATTDDEDELALDVDGDEMDMDVSDDMPMDGGEDHEDHEAIMDKMSDLETALAELKAEFEKLEAEERGEGEDDEDEGDDEGEEEEEESWELDEDFDDIAESLDLEVVTKNMEKSVPAKDVGAASSGMSDGNDARSPTPPSQTTRFGAKPVDIGAGPDHKGYELENAPKHTMDAMKIADPDMKADNRRKSYANGMSRENKEGNKPNAALNTTAKQFGADTVGKMSPLSKGGDNLK